MVRIKACDDAAVCGARGRARVKVTAGVRAIGSTADRGRHLLSGETGGEECEERGGSEGRANGGRRGGVYV